MELFILFGYVAPALITAYIALYEIRKQGYLDLGDLLAFIFVTFTPLINIGLMLTYLCDMDWKYITLWTKKQ